MKDSHQKILEILISILNMLREVVPASHAYDLDKIDQKITELSQILWREDDTLS